MTLDQPLSANSPRPDLDQEAALHLSHAAIKSEHSMPPLAPSIHAEANVLPTQEKLPASEKPEHVVEDERKKLLTSSPEAIRVAAQITPNRLANLLIRRGPLAIRLITGHLSTEVPGFDLLSLSKQRRLIMAAMEHGDSQNNVVFEKIGWGQWAVRYVNSDYIVTEPNSSLDKARLNIHELREKAKLGWLKKADHAPVDLLHLSADTHRRDSISNNKSILHYVTVPGEGLEGGALHESALSDSELDSDVENPGVLSNIRQSSNTLNDDDSDVMMDDEEDENMFAFDDDAPGKKEDRRGNLSPPIKFANRVPITKFSPPPILSGNRRKSSLSSVVKNTSSYNSTRHAQIFNRSRLNSIENLNEYMLSSARNSQISMASPPAQQLTTGHGSALHVASVPTSSPLGSWNGRLQDVYGATDFTISSEQVAALGSRRKLSFNESSIRSTLSLSLPRVHNRPAEHVIYHANKKKLEVASDTDEEDWASMGAELLRTGAGDGLMGQDSTDVPNDESTAARALVNLMST